MNLTWDVTTSTIVLICVEAIAIGLILYIHKNYS